MRMLEGVLVEVIVGGDIGELVAEGRIITGV